MLLKLCKLETVKNHFIENHTQIYGKMSCDRNNTQLYPKPYPEFT